MPGKDVVYFDTSALAKWYLNESFSADVERYLMEHGPVAISDLTVVEMRSLLSRRRREKQVDSKLETRVFATFEDDEEQANYVRFRAKKLFEHELEAWCTDPGKWPSVRNHKTFFAWFEMEVSHMVFDLAGDPIVLQAFDLTKKLDRE